MAGRRRAVVLCAAAVLGASVCWFAVVAYRHRQQSEQQAQWAAEAEDQGAVVLQAAYSTSRLARVPILGALAIRTQTEVMLPDSEVAGRCLELLKTNPELARIWVHLENVDDDMMQRVQQTRPDVDLIRYTE